MAHVGRWHLPVLREEGERMTEYIITVDEAKADFDGNVPISAKQEVVRCRDCKHADEINGGYWCSNSDCLFQTVTPDSFCAWGERREE